LLPLNARSAVVDLDLRTEISNSRHSISCQASLIAADDVMRTVGTELIDW
jgi:hypothetical protein